MTKTRTPAEEALHTAKWARTMTKWLLKRSSGRGPRWQVVNFVGKKGAESRGVVDLMAVRKDHRGKPSPPLKAGDLFEIILIQTKGGSAGRPTEEDLRRLSVVKERYGAKHVVLATWQRGKKLGIELLEGGEWTPASPTKVFG